MISRPVLLAIIAVLLTGCHGPSSPSLTNHPALSPHEAAEAANNAFLRQTTFDPWILTSHDLHSPVPAYFANGRVGCTVGPQGQIMQEFQAGHYAQGVLQPVSGQLNPVASAAPPNASGQTLDMHAGTLTVTGEGKTLVFGPFRPWPALWQASDILINGDPEAQQVTHANLFYLLSSTMPGSSNAIPPMGLSSDVYLGHIFWDADTWMLPALLVQHPAEAKSIVDYRWKTLAQAKRNAAAHGFAGAEYPWESADTGTEQVQGEFAKERHVTADVAWAAWQYYLWTGDAQYLKTEGWPILQAVAQYWVSRVTRGQDGQYHINGVLSPDETAGVVNDDAYTNAVVQSTLRAAARAARLVGQAADPRWAAIADQLFVPYDKARGIPAENSKPLTDRFAAKQADTLLLVYPLGLPLDAETQKKMLLFYSAHTITTGPAMTSSIAAVIAARLGLGPESLAAFQDSYRPFERAPWDAFSEKRTTNTVYFLTGMAGCLQSVLYGFAGLHVAEAGQTPTGTRLAGDDVAVLYVDPHLPPGWQTLTVKGIHFRGRTLNLSIDAHNRVTIQ